MAGEQDRVFSPFYGSGILKSEIGNSAITEAVDVKKCNQAVITNLGTVPCFIKFSREFSDASSEDYLIPPNNTSIALSIDPEADYISYLSSSSTETTIHVIFGNGM